ARPSPTCAYDDDRLRLPPASPARNSKAGKKESMGRRLSQLCPPYATPSSNSSLDYRRSDARIVENGFATIGGVSKSAKVVLEPISKSPEEDNEAGELYEAEEVLGVVFPTDEDAALPLNPSKEALHEPASHIAAQPSPILRG